MKYSKLQGLCKDCLYKCGKCEMPYFTGVYQCKYYDNKPLQNTAEKYAEITAEYRQERIKI